MFPTFQEEAKTVLIDPLTTAIDFLKNHTSQRFMTGKCVSVL